jgi:hypothetical protein
MASLKFKLPTRSVTGRDAYIMAKALSAAILEIDRLPEAQRPYSDQMAMKALLSEICPDDADIALLTGEWATRHE